MLHYREMPGNLFVGQLFDDAEFCIEFYDVSLFSGGAGEIVERGQLALSYNPRVSTDPDHFMAF